MILSINMFQDIQVVSTISLSLPTPARLLQSPRMVHGKYSIQL